MKEKTTGKAFENDMDSFCEAICELNGVYLNTAIIS